MSGPSVAMFHESPSGNVEKSKLINSGQNTTCNEQNNHFYMGALGGENDVISIVQTLASHLARTSNNQWTGADDSGPLPQAVDSGDTTQVDGYQVEVCDMVPPDPSAFPVASIADQYTRAMLERLVGYPLYEPEPLSEHSTEYLCNGVNVGDVGFVREDGAFDFLFNICPPQNSSINPPNLPNDFSLVTPEHSATREMGPLSRATCFCPSTVTKTKSGEYVCKEPEGAILVLPEGAIQHEAVNRGRFEELAKRHGVEWYEYTKTLGRSISNGSLYLVTSFTKCTRQWGIAVFHRSCDPGQGLRFGRKLCFLCFNSTPKYRWKGSSVFVTKVARPNQKDALNQCVLLRGYKIMIRADIFDKLCNNQPPKFDTAILSPSPQAGNGDLTQRQQQATHITGGGVTDRMSTRTRPKDAVVLHANFNSSPIHPSDIINTALLSQNPDAKIALTHDDVWCDLLRDVCFVTLPHGL
ncbi:hypothetical protein M378DRAFT_524170 [Amanita muscaria Koide BX008]|uniref:Uncharacterized protein n=1 Tax=Amanita muscaria (strain Koide BX008) TaxID=946122 RepID=A0A0C2S172_AMAMK|nr:hypothetical protein M378DRAFT_524170 [Amanita muscaria Koide BX008]